MRLRSLRDSRRLLRAAMPSAFLMVALPQFRNLQDAPS